MRIMLLVSSMNGGGAERVAATLANAWVARGDAVTLVPTYSERGDCAYAVSEKVHMAWLADQPLARAWRPVRAVFRLRALRRLIREHSPDVLVSFLTNVNVAALLAARGLAVPVIVSERTDLAARNAGPVLRLLRRLLYPRADGVVVQTQAALARCQARAPAWRNIAVVPNPVPDELAAGSRPARVPAASRRRLSAMGRLVPGKQFGLLMDVFIRLAGDFPAWDLWIWGSGPLHGALRAQAQAAGLGGRIMLPGHTSRPWQELAAADAFVLSSAVEGFPNALLEAMALGLPCVTFDCPSGPAEMTDSGRAGLLVPAGDRAAFESALRRLLADDALRQALGVQAAAAVRERYGLQAVLAHWDGVFAQARRRHDAVPADAGSPA
jgi:glycosyltransferase involved in cell wall biosynthesis